MQLKKIRLSGFKSFVDPVTIPIQSNLVAIVGPNGCGKSNIIDAICWVMGESSAKYLRGESLTDVIFNGSSARKPVGQASIELIFDNQDGSVGGEYASYAEISIRRSINRNAESSWYLNGGRCRRRDILDIFLGTGLGPRSYSIIGQNMISRLIEAKPDEMRLYLEEAAGVSRYRERRRETENRIQHTRENMARLDDIRTELDRQLETLKRQADAAEKYKILKRQERALRASSLAVQWRELDTKRVQYSLQIQQQETGLEAKQAEVVSMTLSIDNMRENQRLATEAFQVIQGRYYAAGNEITRIEQNIHHTRERQRIWQADLKQAQQDFAEAEKNFTEAHESLQVMSQETAQLEPELQRSREQLDALRTSRQSSEEALQSWQQQWDTFNQQFSKTNESVRVEQIRITQLEQRIAHIVARENVLSSEQTEVDTKHFENQLTELQSLADQFTSQMEARQTELATVRDEMTLLQKEQQQKNQQLDKVRHQLQQLRGQRASLEALQQTALGQRDNQVTQWLTEQQLHTKQRLAEGIKVAAGWENAVEKVLGSYLQAVCVDDLSSFNDALNTFKQGTLCLFQSGSHQNNTSVKADRLLSKVSSQWDLTDLLGSVYVANTLDEAIRLSKQLASHESVITKEGIWLGASWLKVLREHNPAAGIFQREQELSQLITQEKTLSEEQKTLETDLVECRKRREQLEKNREALQIKLNEFVSETARVRAQHKMQQQQLTERRERAEKALREQTQITEQKTSLSTELSAARAAAEQAKQALEKLTHQREPLSQDRDRLRDAVQRSRQTTDDAREKCHQLELVLQGIHAKQTALQQSIVRMEERKAACLVRIKSLEEGESGDTSITDLEAALSTALNQRVTVEEELNAARATNDAINIELRDLETARHQAETAVSKVRDALEALRLESEGLRVRANSITEQLDEIQMHLETVLAELPEEATVSIYQEHYEQVTRRIVRLGPINLVAIEEYATCSERKKFLDSQYTDLQSGLETLEAAIAKIDRETKIRFRETFDKVNGRFQELFPTVFGGGRAFLELTGENLLDAGITVMACPPGKRNSTIHLLSGGEKALTAIALVFSIFHLNPAPFCLLDEVDAPLDDANIGRFCDLVKTMSEKTQFIFISHNKLAINMAEQLMGVTMSEPGVSRMVSVNVEEAVSMAES